MDHMGDARKHPARPSVGPVGRVRVWIEDDVAVDSPEPVSDESGGWSARALLLGVVALAIIIGGLLFLYWGAFRFV